MAAAYAVNPARWVRRSEASALLQDRSASHILVSTANAISPDVLRFCNLHIVPVRDFPALLTGFYAQLPTRFPPFPHSSTTMGCPA